MTAHETTPARFADDGHGSLAPRESSNHEQLLGAGNKPRNERIPRFIQLPWKDSSEGVLSASEFECFLERERSLVDRGTRRFSLMVLRGRQAERQGLGQLSRQLRERLRSTDLIGRLDEDRVGVLLTDTEPVGASFVAGWVDRAVAELGLHIEPTIYVYPSVDESPVGAPGAPGAPGASGHDGNGTSHRNGSVQRNGAVNGHSVRRGRSESPEQNGSNGANGANGSSQAASKPLCEGPSSSPPSNGHAAVGRVGLTRELALAAMARSRAEDAQSHAGGIEPSSATSARNGWDVPNTPKNAPASATTKVPGGYNGRGGAPALASRATKPGVPVGTPTTAGALWPMEDLWTHLSLPMPLWKRALDIFLSSIAILLLAPLFAVVAVVIRLDSPGPVIFRQTRAGRGARPFLLYKFRSMHIDAEKRRAELADQNEKDGPIFKIKNDPRITRVGRWLRRYSIDELPQIWNVFKGDISLVGPRSPIFDEVVEYERWQRRRLDVTGGITCIWQVSGRSQIGFREWMRMDMRYVARRSFWLDLWLLVKTLPAVLTGRGAC